MAFTQDAGITTRRFTITRGLGKRRKSRDPEALLSIDEIREEIELDDTNSFWVRGGELPVQSAIYFPTPLDGGLQRINVAATISGEFPGWHQLAEPLSRQPQMLLAYTFNQPYTGWQHCSDIATYKRLYGSTDGFLIRELEPLNNESPPRTRLDLSLNPGRGGINGLLPQRVAAELWLGSSFWQLAPCKKEEVLAADFFLEVRDTPNFLYLKSWPRPFTRPDGEQGRVQQKLWRLLFHEDCEWPPGSGGISDVAVGGPPELMPNGSSIS